MKKRVLISLLLAVVLMVSIPVAVFATTSNTNTPVLNIEARNLSLKDNVQLVFYVSYESVEAADVKLLAWTSAQSSYTVSTLDATLTTVGTTTYNDKTCLLFYYTDMTAKQMTDDLYVRAYTKQGDDVYYSDVAKFSILEYAYTKLGKIGDKYSYRKLGKDLHQQHRCSSQHHLHVETKCR